MKQIVIVGTGMGPDSLSEEGRRALAEATVWFGAPRLLEIFKPLFAVPKVIFPFYKYEEILAVLEQREETCFAVLVSGDTGFYSAAPGIYEALQKYNPRIVPGASSVSAFFARLGLPWQDAALLSVHGRDMTALTGTVRRNRYTFCLTGNNVASIGEALCDAGYAGLRVHTGENLGLPEEWVRTITAEELSLSNLPPLSVLVVVNDDPDDRIRFGLPDTAFDRSDGIPMTKSEVRALSLAKLALKPGDICYDIGAGTGSVTVEMALAAYRGRVYAIERQPDALPLIRENLRRFHLGNVTVIEGEAPEALEELPPPDAVFIGGSGGHIGEIISVIQAKNPQVRMVITAITLETAAAVLAALPQAELTQLSAARAKIAGKSHLLTAQNPVMVISAGGML
ncbi:bifunctional cobalt-precorrin-7 (C(5))-methyltransferase/cobalt-precorrin-6B (C(15))-methyltransferase [Spirochaetia bacterium]|nr:bifunctional cobalt-precorrin-7 (C(5))-methyltransferase/cobalt-precorrin-6B (C(15))-methyltransferase [Spirochaetia bacterium]